jgi:hypothetical protein
MDVDLGSLWGLLTVIGPIVLGVVILWAILHNRTSRAEDARTEEATRRMYDKQSREDSLSEG